MLTSGVRKQTPISTYREFASTGQCVGLAVDGSSNIYITLTIGNKIGKVTYPGAVVTDFAGSGTPSNQDGNGISASFNSPGPLAIDSTVNSNLYVGDTGNGTVRKIVTIASSGKAVGDVTTISFSVPGITALAVSSDGSNMIAVSSNTYPYYYVAGVDLGKATNATNAATYGVACRPGNLFYRFPTGGSGSIPALLEVSATAGSTSVNTASPVSLSQISGFLSNVTMSPSTYNGNTFVSGTVVTLSGFSLADLNGITPTLGNGTNSGTIQFTYTFSRTLSTSVSSTGTVSAPIPVETQSVVSVDGTGVGGGGIGVGHFEDGDDAPEDRAARAAFKVFFVRRPGLAEMHLLIDQAGQHGKALGVVGFRAAVGRQFADGGDLAVLDADVGFDGAARRENRAAVNHQIKGHVELANTSNTSPCG